MTTPDITPLAASILEELHCRSPLSLEDLRERVTCSSITRFNAAIAELERLQRVQRGGSRIDPELKLLPASEIPAGHKRCRGCQQIKPVDAFSAGLGLGGRHDRCKACRVDEYRSRKNPGNDLPTEQAAHHPQQEKS